MQDVYAGGKRDGKLLSVGAGVEMGEGASVEGGDLQGITAKAVDMEDTIGIVYGGGRSLYGGEESSGWFVIGDYRLSIGLFACSGIGKDRHGGVPSVGSKGEGSDDVTCSYIELESSPAIGVTLLEGSEQLARFRVEAEAGSVEMPPLLACDGESVEAEDNISGGGERVKTVECGGLCGIAEYPAERIGVGSREGGDGVGMPKAPVSESGTVEIIIACRGGDTVGDGYGGLDEGVGVDVQKGMNGGGCVAVEVRGVKGGRGGGKGGVTVSGEDSVKGKGSGVENKDTGVLADSEDAVADEPEGTELPYAVEADGFGSERDRRYEGDGVTDKVVKE
jgi:hypothetical protein